ncbi:BCL-6 corepressor-like protein 1 isoform X2 [Osmerus eperlanus]|uniref:BCL-6 corepressor-like protein 1 isoform X1 n=1 Tax=Osmerus eperlanus TaxID=29151 RepID=UPI002E15110F
MQVDPTPMNLGDGGRVSRETSALKKVSASMVGNPPQTLSPELRGDVPLSQQNKTTTVPDCKMANACSEPGSFNRCPEVPPPHQCNNPMPGPALVSSNKRAEKVPEVPKHNADDVSVLPAHQWPTGTKVSPENPVNPSHSIVTSNKKSHTQTQSVISLPTGFQRSTIYKSGQSVAFLPSTNFSSSLCKITLPPALGQIAALREATASQFQKETQSQSSGAGGAPLLRTFPYHYSLGRGPTPEKKAATSTSKLKCSSTSSSKGSKAAGEHKSAIASVVASPTMALPIQHPALGPAPPSRFTLSPTATICCGSAQAGSTAQSRLLNHVEKAAPHRGVDKTSAGFLKPKSPSATDDNTASCPVEARDVPLDLSAKSKRPKSVVDRPNAVAAAEHHAAAHESHQKDALDSKRLTAYASTAPYPVLPITHRNGAHQKQTNRPPNSQVLEPKSSWAKGCSQDSISNLPGTYVGVASPILASTLRSKDGKGTFVDEFQTFAKQEFISIIDQGEQLPTRGKKPSFMTKGNQHVHGVKHPNSTSPAVTQSCPSKGALSTALPGSANAFSHQKPGSGKAATSYSASVIKPLWQQQALLPRQGASVQRKVMQGTLKIKASTGSEGPKFHSADQSLSRMEDDKWDRIKSPLSNLESIVKQKALETTALTGEGYCHLAPVASRKPETMSSHTESRDPLCRQTTTTGSPAENKDGVPESPSSQGNYTLAMSRLEKHESRDKSAETKCLEGKHNGRNESQVSTKSPAHTHAFGSSANRNRMESKLAQELEGVLVKEESVKSGSISPNAKLEGIALSILTGQCTTVAEVEKKTKGPKEESPTDVKVALTKQKKATPRKPAKQRSPSDPLKKTTSAAPKKKEEANENKKTLRPKKKKPCSPVLEQTLSVEEEPSQRGAGARSSPCNGEQAAHTQPGIGSSSAPSLQSPEAPVSQSVGGSGRPSKEPETSESCTPRLRRGRRRADEARLDHWGFCTPSPPPPPPPPAPPTLPAPPVRRPRGRPRTNPLPEQGKAKSAVSAEGETPTRKKRRRCRNRKYQNGEYITERDKVVDGEGEEIPESTRHVTRAAGDLRTGMYPRLSASLTCPSASPELTLRRPPFTRSGSVRLREKDVSPEPPEKPSGKRKFKSKHLCDPEEQKKLKPKRGNLGKRSSLITTDEESPDAKKPAGLPATPKGSPSPLSNKKGSSVKGGAPESPPSRPVPPEVRRLIVNKNAGETLLQRAARLGYQDVVLYCLEKDVREVNRRDNAGYTALHEACSRGWSQIVQVLLEHGADVNCSAQDGTRPIHDAVASDNLPVVWMLLNHGADPTLATYSGQTPVKLAQSHSMKTFLKEYFTDLEGRGEQDPSLSWDFYSSSLFESDQEACWDYLLSQEEKEEQEERDGRKEKDCLLFEFSSEPLLLCYHVQVSLTQGFCNWFLLADVLKRLKMSSRIFRARYPHFEVVSLARAELRRQVSISQVTSAPAQPLRDSIEGQEEEEGEDGEEREGSVELVRCVLELQGLLGSSIHVLHEEDEGEEGGKDKTRQCHR